MAHDDIKYGNHKANKVYIEIHFESPKYSPLFKNLVENLVINNNELESFYWRDYCPGIRLIENGYENLEKKLILENLKKLKDLTLESLRQCYLDSICFSKWKSGFELKKNNKKISRTRALTKFQQEPKEILIEHENIKSKLIANIKIKPDILGPKNRIDITSISEENEVNGINYVDLVSQTLDKRIIFFEIKTSNDPRICIRQALGQLMEYSFFPNVNFADMLIVVGTGPKTDLITTYIKTLNSKFKINIDYLQVR